MKLVPLLACLLPSIPLAQKTIHVPGDAPSIQIGIAIADDGDTVLVSPGWYYEQIDFLGRAITLKSTDGPSLTTIKSEGSLGWLDQPRYSTIRFISKEGPSSIVDGFTITAIAPPSASAFFPQAGIWCGGANPTIRNCVIQDCWEAHGLYGHAVVKNCTFRNNNAGYRDGGGVSGSATLDGCLIENNHGWDGGGIELFGGVARNCIIRGNTAGEGGKGGGIDARAGALIENCVIYQNHNTDPQYGGAGAGVYSFDGTATVRNCVIWGNVIWSYFGGASGVYGGAKLENCIIWGNLSMHAEAPQLFGAVATYTNVEGGFAGIGNISSAPLFLGVASGDFRLLPNSPCIDAGDPLVDLDPDGSVADMGAFPFDQYPSCVPAKVPVAAKVAFDHVGSVVAAGSSYVIAGTPDVNGPGFESGAAFMAYRDGPVWVALPKLLAGDETPGALFGASVALSDGVTWIGAPGVSAETGAAYAFRQQEDGAWAEEVKLMASDGTSGSRFGSRVAVQGDVAAASAPLANAPGSDSGAVYVFKDGASGWAEIAKLTALDGAAGDHFGSGLAISGSRLLIGAEGDASGAGSAYVFEDAGFGWGQQAKLVASDASANEQFGNVVGLDGDVAVIGAPAADGLGAAYVFRRSGFTWTQEQKLTASAPSPNAEFGHSVAIAGNRIVVGARADDSAGSNAGAAYLFEFNGSAWVQTQKLTLPGTQTGDAAGSGVALSGDYVLVGAEWADDPEQDSGELWAFAAPGTCFPKLTTVPGAQAQGPDQVTAVGTYLSQVQQVTIGGTAVPVISATATTLTYQPQPDDPGFLPLAVSGPEGSGQGLQQLYPSLAASTTGVGGTLKVTLDNGIGGLYALAMGFHALAAPISILSPPSWYGVMLNPAAPLFVIGQGAFATSEPIALTYNVPANPTLIGLDLYLQAWCQQGFFGPDVTYSFTNMAGVVL